VGLLRVLTRLGLPLLGSSKLRAHISSQPGLFGKAIPFCLLFTKELGFALTASNNDLKRRPVSETQKYLEKEENEEERADTWLVGMTISRRAPLTWSRAFIIVKSPKSRLSRSMLSAWSSSVKRADAGS